MVAPKHSVIQYFRRKNAPRGALVAIKTQDGFRVGYSLCRKGDRFNKKMAIQIAIGRANHAHSEESTNIPREIRKIIPEFTQRCRKYYKV